MTNSIEGAMPPLPEEIEAAISKFGNMCSFGSFDASLESVKELRASIQAYAAPLLARVAELQADAARYRWLVNASELPFPPAAIADDPENDARMVYGRKRLEALIDLMDEIPNTYKEQP